MTERETRSLDRELRAILIDPHGAGIGDALRILTNIARSKYGPQIGDEIAQVSMIKFLEGVKKDNISADLNPTAYLLVIMRRTGIDTWRRESSGKRSLPVGISESDIQGINENSVHDVVTLLGGSVFQDPFQDSSAALLVEEALRYARDRKDFTAYRAAVCFLDRAELEGESPSSRTVAEILGVSHTTIASALRRFRDYVLVVKSSPQL